MRNPFTKKVIKNHLLMQKYGKLAMDYLLAKKEVINGWHLSYTQKGVYVNWVDNTGEKKKELIKEF